MEMALLKVKNDILLIDLSAAFDMVDHVILLRALGSLGIGGTVIEWYRSYLSGRGQHVSVCGCTYERTVVYRRAPALDLCCSQSTPGLC